MRTHKLRLQAVEALFASLLLLLLFLVNPAALAQEHKSQECTVEISSPRQGENVAGDAQVKGTAKIPAGEYLWIFAHRKGLALWWPQGGGPAVVENGKWVVATFFGVERDVGRDFELATAVVDSDANNELLKWVKRAEETGQYSGVRFPSLATGCTINQVTVTRTK